MHKKDLAKFFAGVATIEVIHHAVLGISNVLPFEVFGFMITSAINFWILLGWIMIMIFCVYYAWGKK